MQRQSSIDYVKCISFKGGRCGCLKWERLSCEEVFVSSWERRLKKGESERSGEPVWKPVCFLCGVRHTEVVKFLGCSVEWSTWNTFRIHKSHLRNALSELHRDCRIALQMVHVPGLTVLLRMSQCYGLIGLLISIRVFVDVECSLCILTGVASISLHSCLQVTGTVFVKCNGCVFLRRKTHMVFCLNTELTGCKYKHISTVLSPS